MEAVKATCCYCGAVSEGAGGWISGVNGDPDHAADFGRLCTKESTPHAAAQQGSRALFPEYRRRHTGRRL
jgi:assimilatory nitrate reductase catalytic subunit